MDMILAHQRGRACRETSTGQTHDAGRAKKPPGRSIGDEVTISPTEAGVWNTPRLIRWSVLAQLLLGSAGIARAGDRREDLVVA